jgi:hypothetical protein
MRHTVYLIKETQIHSSSGDWAVVGEYSSYSKAIANLPSFQEFSDMFDRDSIYTVHKVTKLVSKGSK